MDDRAGPQTVSIATRPRRRFLGALCVILSVGFFLGSGLVTSASAQESDSESVTAETETATENNSAPEQSLKGRLQDLERNGVEGVVISVTTEDGTEVGSDTSNANGEWQVSLPEEGTYVVSIDESTLPDDLTLRDSSKASLTIGVRAGQDKNALFALNDGEGSDGRVSVSRLNRLSNLAAEGVKFGFMIALAALGLSLVFGVTNLVNFAHGELLAFGAITAFWLERGIGPIAAMPLLLAVVGAVILAGGLGTLFEKGVFGPVRARGSGDIAAMIISIGLALVVRHLYLILFGSRAQFYRGYRLQSTYSIGPVSLTPKSWFIIVIAGAVLLAFGWALQNTRIGTAMRAVSANKDLANSSGIDVNRVVMATWFVGSALAGLAGAMFGLAESIQWNMGYELLLFIFAAVVLGGLGTAYGAMLGGLVVGLVTQLSTYWFPSQMKLMFALVVLVVILIFRPSGILGLKERFG